VICIWARGAVTILAGVAEARVQAATKYLATDALGAGDRYANAFEAWLALGGAA